MIDIDQHPIPRLDDLLLKLKGQQYSTIDLADAYMQLELDEESKKLMTINTPWGLYRYNRLCFGVASAPAIFQRLMDALIADLPGVAAYIDDLVVSGETEEEHLNNLTRLFERLQEYGLRIELSKCNFMQDSDEYLGHIIDKNGKRPSNSSVKAIQDLPKPSNTHEVKAFLGKINYYHSFIPDAPQLTAPLNKLLKKESKFEWTSDCDNAFSILKDRIIRACRLLFIILIRQNICC